MSDFKHSPRKRSFLQYIRLFIAYKISRMRRGKRHRGNNVSIPFFVLFFASIAIFTICEMADSASYSKRVKPVMINQPESVTVLPTEPITEPMTEDNIFIENPSEKVIYLTIDDGPCSHTNQLLEILKKYNIEATFFVTAQFMTEDNLTEVLAQIHNNGHAIGVHTYSHKFDTIYDSVDAYMADYKQMDDIIFKATEQRSRIFRFPGGSNTRYNKKIRKSLLKKISKEHLIYYDWNAFTGDTDKISKTKMIKKTISESTYNNKTILLMHDAPNKENMLKILPKIIKILKKKGYTFRKLDESISPIQFVKQKY